MSSKKHEPTVSELDRPYEPNEIGVGGVVKFAIGLLLLIVVTFVLMNAFYGVLEEYSAENFGPPDPMMMTDKEHLPPEPRVQGAPGFGVDAPGGRVNMELGAPQAEYRELKKQWDEMRERGYTDPKTGMMTSIPIDEAKAKLLEQNVKAKSGADAEKFASESRKYISDASSGRNASASRR
ncbi:MAG: hypothetical protein ACRD6X_04845 [Pyrinomonadaceae bacterium]